MVHFTTWVGVVRTPCGAQIEILPKTGLERSQTSERTRMILVRMLACLPEMQHIRPGLLASLVAQPDTPLCDMFIAAFLHSVT